MARQDSGWARFSRKPQPRRRSPQQAVTAAAQLLSTRNIYPGSKENPERPWQERALALYDLLGEIWYPSQFYARSLSRLRFYVGQADGDEVTEADPASREAQVLDRIQVPSWVNAFGQLQFLNGDGRLVGYVDAEDGATETWDFVSVVECKRNDRGYELDSGGEIGRREYREADPALRIIEPGTMRAYRFWERHPRRRGEADCPLRANIEVAEELLALTWATQARTRSRLAGAGLFLIPEEVEPPPLDDQADDDERANPWLAKVLDAMEAAVNDPTSAAALAPITVQVAAEYIEQFRLLRFYDTNDAYPEAAMREGVIKRLALGLDMPPEVLLGIGDLNHWNAWQVDEQVWKAHIQPMADRLVDDLTRTILWPGLQQEGIADPGGWQVFYDEAEVVNRPDPWPRSLQAHEAGVISDRTLRESGDFSEDDMPTEEEPNSNPKVTGAGSPEADVGEPPAGPGDTQPEPPERQAIIGAAGVALHRCREAAGARLRTTLQRANGEIAETFSERARQADNAALPALLGTGGVEALGISGSLVPESTSRGIGAALQVVGLGPAEARQIARQIVGLAEATIYEHKAPVISAEMLWPASRP